MNGRFFNYLEDKKMIDVVLKKIKMTTIGGSNGFIVPAAYIKNGLVMKNYEYEVVIKDTSKVGGGSPQEGQMIRKHPLKPEELEKEFKDINKVC